MTTIDQDEEPAGSGLPANTRDYSKIAVWDILRNLNAAQMWGLCAALVTILTGSFYLGAQYRPLTQSSSQRSSELAQDPDCAKTKGYPAGYWKLAAVKVHSGDDRAVFSDEIVFTENTKGIWYSEPRKPDKSGTYPDTLRHFEADRPLEAGNEVILNFHDDDNFHSTYRMRVSPDGCWMHGDAQDFRNDIFMLSVGLQYCWLAVPKFVCPAIDEPGWRAADPRQQVLHRSVKMR